MNRSCLSQEKADTVNANGFEMAASFQEKASLETVPKNYVLNDKFYSSNLTRAQRSAYHVAKMRMDSS